MSAAFDFLEKLRPGGPWALIAINPDQKAPPITVTARCAKDVDSFVNTHNGKRNIYYSVNPIKAAAAKKAKKEDIAAIEYLLADLDPRNDETSEAAKTRYLAQVNGSFEPKPTAVVNSGNGIQCLWKLAEPIQLTANASATIADVEARSAALMLRLGAKAGTQNIDRILRLPGTTNLPTEAKRKLGSRSRISQNRLTSLSRLSRIQQKILDHAPLIISSVRRHSLRPGASGTLVLRKSGRRTAQKKAASPPGASSSHTSNTIPVKRSPRLHTGRRCSR